MTARLRKPTPGVYCWQCDGVGDYCPTCDVCASHARWSVCNVEGYDLEPIARWFACGRHLHSVLDAAQWDVDVVHIYDLAEPVNR